MVDAGWHVNEPSMYRRVGFEQEIPREVRLAIMVWYQAMEDARKRVRRANTGRGHEWYEIWHSRVWLQRCGWKWLCELSEWCSGPNELKYNRWLLTQEPYWRAADDRAVETQRGCGGIRDFWEYGGAVPCELLADMVAMLQGRVQSAVDAGHRSWALGVLEGAHHSAEVLADLIRMAGVVWSRRTHKGPAPNQDRPALIEARAAAVLLGRLESIQVAAQAAIDDLTAADGVSEECEVSPVATPGELDDLTASTGP